MGVGGGCRVGTNLPDHTVENNWTSENAMWKHGTRLTAILGSELSNILESICLSLICYLTRSCFSNTKEKQSRRRLFGHEPRGVFSHTANVFHGRQQPVKPEQNKPSSLILFRGNQTALKMTAKLRKWTLAAYEKS